ncbi:MAG: YfhO family protein [bacterium]|nr:YfhO family protein [bacterium]
MRIRANSYLSVWILGLLLAVGRFWHFFVGKTFLYGDNFSLMVPGKLFTIEWLRQGVLPLWNPLLLAGITWIGDINQSILYPSTFFFLILSPANALNITILSHLVLTFAGAYFLARRLKFSYTAAYFVAIVWSCSPQIAGSINNIATLQSLSLLPWIVWAGLEAQRSLHSAIAVGLLVALQLLGGYPQYVLYAVAFSFLLSLSWQRETKFVQAWLLAGVVAIGASAVAWLPFLPTLTNSTRVVQSLDQAGSGSLLLGELMHAILPTFFYNPALGIKWGFLWSAQPNVVMYFGWFGLLLLGVGLAYFKQAPRFIKTLWLIFAVSLLLSFGEAMPWFSLLQHVPLFGDARGASGILQLTALSGALVIGWSFDFCRSKNELRWGRVLWLAALAVILAGVAWLVVSRAFSPLWEKADLLLSGRLSQSVFHTLERDALILKNILQAATFTSTLLVFSLFFWLQKKYKQLLVCVALDLIFNTSHLFFFAPKEIYSTELAKNEVITLMEEEDLTQYRVLTRNYNTPYTDFGAYWDALAVRQPFSDSYIDAKELKNYEHLQRMRSGATPDWNMAFGIPVINGYTTLLPQDVQERFVGSTVIEASINNLPEIPTSHQALAEWSVAYYVRDTWFPLYGATMPEELIAETDNLALYQLPAKPRFRHEDDSAAQLLERTETPNSISLLLDATNRRELIVADRYDKDWRATVNGKEVEIDNHNGMRRILLEQGRNDVQLWYEPRAFYVGLVVTATTLLACLVIFLPRKSKI